MDSIPETTWHGLHESSYCYFEVYWVPDVWWCHDCIIPSPDTWWEGRGRDNMEGWNGRWWLTVLLNFSPPSFPPSLASRWSGYGGTAQASTFLPAKGDEGGRTAPLPLLPLWPQPTSSEHHLTDGPLL